MSNQNNNEREFCPGVWVKEKKFDNGGSILKVSILAEKFGPFVKKHKNKAGYINIIISPKRNPDDKSTHISYLDTWEPKNPDINQANQSSPNQTPKQAAVSQPDQTDF